MSTTQPTQPNTTVSLEQAIHLARAGNKEGAAMMLRTLVAAQPLNQAAWLWLSAVAPTRTEAEAALAQARKIDAAHPSLPKAEQWLARRFSEAATTRQTATAVDATPPPPKAEPSSPPSRPRPPTPAPPASSSGLGFLSAVSGFVFGLVILAVVLGLMVLLAGLAVEVTGAAQASASPPSAVEVRQQQLQAQLMAAEAARDWPEALLALEALHGLQPESAAIVTRLADTHLQQGISLRSRGFVAEALQHFEAAQAVRPDNGQAAREAALAAAYLAGTEQYQAGQWPAAITHLEEVWAADRNYGNIRDLLYSTYYNHGLAQQAARNWQPARTAFESAAGLRPDLSDPRRLLAEIDFALAGGEPVRLPSLTAIEDRLILVGVAEQQMWVFDGSKKIFDFVVSTGEPGRDTAIGEFEILNKIDMAYASTWNLDMPFWMGIYWAGPLQNGIHSLPIVKHTGYKLWDGYLGQRVSYGCVILSDADAATLYEWTEIGTTVKIVPSLAGWQAEQAIEAE